MILLPLSAFVRIKLLLMIFRDSLFSVTFKLVEVEGGCCGGLEFLMILAHTCRYFLSV